MDAMNPPSAALIRRLDTITTLPPEARQALLDLPMKTRDLKTDTDIVREGDRPSQCCLVLEGFLCRYKLTDEGKRQILSFHIPGDIPDLLSIHLHVMDHNLGTLIPSRVAFIPHEALRDVIHQHTTVADSLWRDTLIDAAVFREWMVGIGRRPAVVRIAHLLCELLVRFRAIGLARDFSCEFSATQAEIGDALGLSTVHVNRSLQELRGQGFITLSGGVLTARDWDGLKKAGEFDPSYLHLQETAMA